MTFGRTRRSAGGSSYASEQSPGAVVAGAVPTRERGDRDARAGMRCVDETSGPDVDADVAEPVEEDEVAGPQRAAGDTPALAELRARVVRQVDPEVGVDEACEPGAVEAA